VTIIANANFDEADDIEARAALMSSCQSLTEALGGMWI
jgi:hypothetical protein